MSLLRTIIALLTIVSHFRYTWSDHLFQRFAGVAHLVQHVRGGQEASAPSPYSSAERQRYVEFDEHGDLPQLQGALRAVQFASTVVVMNTANSTLISVVGKQPGTEALHISETSSSAHRAFCNIGGRNFLCITGLSGDATILIRSLKLYALDYKSDFGSYPTGRQIAEEAAKLMQKASVGSRPLAVHVFVVDNNPVGEGLRSNEIYEIETSGIIQRVVAGLAGKGSDSIKSKLEGSYLPHITTKAAKLLAATLISEANNSRDTVSASSTCVDHFEIFNGLQSVPLSAVDDCAKLS
jgi:20S proteasome alpha/beta subunit